MIWAVLASLCFALTLTAIKQATYVIYPILANVLFSTFALLVQLTALFVFVRLKGADISLAPQALLMSAIGGAFLGLYSIFTFLAISDLDISRASPTIYVGGISIASIIGIFIFGESLTWINAIGMLLACVALFLIFFR